MPTPTEATSRSGRRIAADLARSVWRYRRRTVVSLALMIAAKLSTVLIPLVLKHVVDALGRPVAAVFFPIFLVLAYALLRFLGDALNEARDVVFSIVTQRTVAAFTERTFAHLHGLSARFHTRRETGAIVRDVQKGADGIGFLLGVALFAIVPTLFEIATIMAIMVHNYAWPFALAIAATFVCYAAYTFVFTRRRAVVQRAVNAFEAQTNGRLVDSLLNYDTVKYFATGAAETRRLSEVLEQWVHARTANQRALTLLHVGQSGVVALGVAAIMLLATQQVLAGQMSVGDLILVNAFVIQICMPLNTLGFVFRETSDALVNVERMFAILESRGRLGEDIDKPGAQPLVVGAGNIEFEQVDFGYEPERKILREVNFRAYAGKTLAVVGGSGSGKSTIVKLLFRLYQPGRGVIRIDGQDIGAITQHSLREAIGIVPQDTVLFNETIAYNIAYGRVTATHDDVVHAARAAQLETFIERLPDRYETRVGERGVRLSGGERQRIAIARAILKNPRIIVFDEATSALDTRSERAIQIELMRLAQGRTSIVIAHRLSTVVEADWILVMEHGRVVEQGSHPTLLASDGVYRKMWSLQWQQGELEHAQRKLAAQAISVARLASNVVEALHDESKLSQVTLAIEADGADWQVTGDPSVLQPAIAALCRNEIERALPGQRVTLRIERRHNHAWLSVLGMHDEAGGLSQGAAQQTEAVLSAAGGGLTLVPWRGRLAYAAMLPLLPLADADAGAAVGRPDFRAALLDDMLVMVIDDQEETRDALEAVLVASGARVQLAASGADALNSLANAPARGWPQVILCDIVLPGEDGYEILGRLRALEGALGKPSSASVPAIVLTGYAGAENRARAERAGFHEHLTKPVAPDLLIEAIRSARRSFP